MTITVEIDLCREVGIQQFLLKGLKEEIWGRKCKATCSSNAVSAEPGSLDLSSLSVTYLIPLQDNLLHSWLQQDLLGKNAQANTLFMQNFQKYFLNWWWLVHIT